jgi:hypothetical protein
MSGLIDPGGEEKLNRTEHREDQKDYQKDRDSDAADRVQAADEVEEARLARADELEKLVREKERTHKKIGAAQLVAYLLIVIVSVFAWQKSTSQDHHICRSAEANRQAVRNVVIAIEQLGTELVTDDGTPPTPEQQVALDRFKKFKEDQLALLELPACK